MTSAAAEHVCVCEIRCAVESVAQWDSPMQVRLSAWRSGLNTLLVELLPWALLVNRSRWDLWMFEAESIIVQIPAGKTIVPPNFKVSVCITAMYLSESRITVMSVLSECVCVCV